jgi:hypothetical protein
MLADPSALCARRVLGHRHFDGRRHLNFRFHNPNSPPLRFIINTVAQTSAPIGWSGWSINTRAQTSIVYSIFYAIDWQQKGERNRRLGPRISGCLPVTDWRMGRGSTFDQ